MSTNEDLNIEDEPLNVLTRKHKQERKDLQAKIQGLKKSATKGDKKRKKEVQEEIVKLEAELDERQKKEENALREELQKMAVEDSSDSKQQETERDNPDLPSKLSKAQKRRVKKSVASNERAARIEAQEIENLQGPRHKEISTITDILRKRGLAMFPIEADGNCLYSAIEHQLKQRGVSQGGYDYKALRKLTADHLRNNAQDFLPFLSNFVTGDQMSDKDFEEYCGKVEKTTAWGGQIELRALADALQRPIEVIQAVGPPLIIGEEFATVNNALIVTFHRYMYRLGEHYNSVAPFVNDDDEEN